MARTDERAILHTDERTDEDRHSRMIQTESQFTICLQFFYSIA